MRAVRYWQGVDMYTYTSVYEVYIFFVRVFFESWRRVVFGRSFFRDDIATGQNIKLLQYSVSLVIS